MSGPACYNCGTTMTPQNARLRPELFSCDSCLPDEFKPRVAPYTVMTLAGRVAVYDSASGKTVEWPEQEAARRLLAYDGLVRACRAAKQFIANGIEYDYIDKPAKGSPESLTLPMLQAVLAAEPNTPTGA